MIHSSFLNQARVATCIIVFVFGNFVVVDDLIYCMHRRSSYCVFLLLLLSFVGTIVDSTLSRTSIVIPFVYYSLTSLCIFVPCCTSGCWFICTCILLHCMLVSCVSVSGLFFTTDKEHLPTSTSTYEMRIAYWVE